MGRGGILDAQDKKHVVEEKIASIGTGVSALNTFGLIIFCVVLVEVLLLIFLNIYEKSRIDNLTGQINTSKTQLATSDYATINSQIDSVITGQTQLQAALNKKVPWSKFYTMLDAVTPKDVQLNNLSINDDGNFKADGETTSLTSLAKAMVAWRDGTGAVKTPFSTITLGGNGYTNDATNRRVAFSITGQIDLGIVKAAQ
ncbi:MAG TPA: hypothetical protein VMQ44_03725 [Candidatus Saccharimonadales bacterium]|nr:hypothetical protein [Candidatus Saccharimonadales bacterium]